MAFLPIAGAAVGGRIGAFLAGKVGQMAANKVLSGLASRELGAATKFATEKLGGTTVGKAANWLEGELSSPTSNLQSNLMQGAQWAGEKAAPIIGAHIGMQAAKSLGRGVSNMANMGNQQPENNIGIQ